MICWRRRHCDSWSNLAIWKDREKKYILLLLYVYVLVAWGLDDDNNNGNTIYNNKGKLLLSEHRCKLIKCANVLFKRKFKFCFVRTDIFSTLFRFVFCRRQSSWSMFTASKCHVDHQSVADTGRPRKFDFAYGKQYLMYCIFAWAWRKFHQDKVKLYGKCQMPNGRHIWIWWCVDAVAIGAKICDEQWSRCGMNASSDKGAPRPRYERKKIQLRRWYTSFVPLTRVSYFNGAQSSIDNSFLFQHFDFTVFVSFVDPIQLCPLLCAIFIFIGMLVASHICIYVIGCLSTKRRTATHSHMAPIIPKYQHLQRVFHMLLWHRIWCDAVMLFVNTLTN